MKTLISAFVLCMGIALAQAAPPLQLQENPHSVQATNVSAKPIVFVAVATVLSANAPARSGLLSTHDYIFKPMMAPGDTREVVHPDDNDATISGPDGKQTPLPPPTNYGHSYLVFVQFADGTSWGAPDEHISHLLAIRKAKLQFLDDLLALYNSGGDAAFAARLKTEFETKGLWKTPAGHLLRMHDNMGPSMALGELQQMVNYGHARPNLIQ